MGSQEEAELQRFVAAQSRAIRELTARLDLVAQIEGPDAVTRRKLLQLAQLALNPQCSQLERELAASNLALLVLKTIPAPRPVAVPSPVAKEEKSAC